MKILLGFIVLLVIAGLIRLYIGQRRKNRAVNDLLKKGIIR